MPDTAVRFMIYYSPVAVGTADIFQYDQAPPLPARSAQCLRCATPGREIRPQRILIVGVPTRAWTIHTIVCTVRFKTC